MGTAFWYGAASTRSTRTQEIFSVLDELLGLSADADRGHHIVTGLARLEALLAVHFQEDERQVFGGAEIQGPLARTHRSILEYISRLGHCLAFRQLPQARMHLRFLDHLLTNYLGGGERTPSLAGNFAGNIPRSRQHQWRRPS